MRGFFRFACYVCVWLSTAHTFSTERTFDRFLVEDGLSQTSIQAIAQDSIGFLWFGTQDGLNRYDGYSFQHFKYDPSDDESISENMIFDILEDEEQMLWIATERGLNRFNPFTGKFKRYRHDPGTAGTISHDRVYRLHLDRDGTLWVATLGGGLNRFNPSADRFEHYLYDHAGRGRETSNRIWDIAEDRDGRLWLCSNAGLMLFDREEHSFTSFPLPRADANPDDTLANVAWSIWPEDDGRLLVGTFNDGLYRFDPKHNLFTRIESPHLRDRWVLFVKRGQQGRLWVGLADYGLVIFERDMSSAKLYQHDPASPKSLVGNHVMAMFESRDGLIWVGTGAGLARYDPRRELFGHAQQVPGEKDSLKGNLVRGFAETSDGTVWIANSDGLTRFEAALGIYQAVPQEDSGDPFLGQLVSIAAGPEDNLWLGGHFEGIYRYSPGSGRYRLVKPDPLSGLTIRRVNAMQTDADGKVWLATTGDGLVRFDPESETFEGFYNEIGNLTGLRSSMIVTLMVDQPHDAIWVGTRVGGLHRFDLKTRTFKAFPLAEEELGGLSHPYVASIFRDSQDRLWVGTLGGGLNLYQEDTKTFGVVWRGLKSTVVNGILEDSRGDLWLSTNAGIVRAKVNHPEFFKLFLGHADSDQPDGLLQHFDTVDGLQSREFNVGATYLDRTGHMWFGGLNGLNRFLPENLDREHYDAPVVITTVHTLQAKPVTSPVIIPSEERLTLNQKDHGFTARFAVLDYRMPERNRFAYQLAGFHNEWTSLDDSNTLTLTGLPAGKYTLHVRGVGSSGVWQDMATPLAIRVKAAPWFSFWAKLGYGLIVLLFVAWVSYLYRMVIKARAEAALQRELDNRQKDKMESLGRLAGGIAHDFNNMLASMLGFNSLAMIDLTKEHPVYTHLNEVDKAGRRAKELIQQILTFSKQGKPELRPVPVVKVVRDALKLARISFPPEISLNESIDEKAGWIVGDATRLHQVVLNLCTNAKEAIGDNRGAVDVTLSVRESNEPIPKPYVVIAIADNGVGMSGEMLAHIFEPFYSQKSAGKGVGMGLSVVHGIVMAMKGRIEVESEPGKGSTFAVWLPRSGDSRVDLERPTKSLPAGRDRIIWLLDDEEPLITAWAALLRREGYRTRVFTEPEELLRQFKEKPELPDLILTDWRMPTMSGEEVGREIKKLRSDLPMILCSGMASGDTWQKATANFDAFLSKPFTVETLSKAFRLCLPDPRNSSHKQKPPSNGSPDSDQTPEDKQLVNP